MLRGMATQLGLATMPRCIASAPGFTSGTTSGTAGSMRYALDLSTAMPPDSATAGAWRRDVAAPAAKNTMSAPRSASAESSRTTTSPRYVGTRRPALRLLAYRSSADAGNDRSPRMPTSVPPAAPVAPTTATAGPLDRIACCGLCWSAGSLAPGFLLLRELTDRLAPREVHPSSIVDLDHLDHDLVTDIDDVLNLVDMVFGELADADQTLFLGHDLDEGTEAHQARHLALVDAADLDVVGQVVDHRHRLLARCGIGRRDEHPAVVFHVDLSSGLLDDLADHLAARADHVADLVGVDVDHLDARCPRAQLGPRRGKRLSHLAEDVQPAHASLLERTLHQVPAETLDLAVHL